MSSTNKTTYYELSQYVGTDIINPLTDFNGDNEKIDTALHSVATAVAESTSDISVLEGKMSTAESDIDALEAQNGTTVLTTTDPTLSGAINEVNAKANANTASITSLVSRTNALEASVGSEALITTAQTVTGAINELASTDADYTYTCVGTETLGQVLATIADNVDYTKITARSKISFAWGTAFFVASLAKIGSIGLRWGVISNDTPNLTVMGVRAVKTASGSSSALMTTITGTNQCTLVEQRDINVNAGDVFAIYYD